MTPLDANTLAEEHNDPAYRGKMARAQIDAGRSQVRPQGETADRYKLACDRIGALLDARLEARRKGVDSP